MRATIGCVNLTLTFEIIFGETLKIKGSKLVDA